MIALGHLSLVDRSGLAWDRLSIEAQLTSQGHVTLIIEQGIEPDRPWGSLVTLMPTISLSDLRVLRDLLSSVLYCAEACLEAATRPPPAGEDPSAPGPSGI
ncbi:MAG: hypothetical protein M0002_02505 [Rhodospirillales bacterium]|nr:hypothetical protein [Rhodospirillales bacterium]